MLTLLASAHTRAGSPVTAFFRFVLYWAWGGIFEAAKLGKRIKYPPYTQYHLSMMTMLLGAALVAPGEMWTPLSSFLQLWMPEFWWGLGFLLVGRFGLHAMLTTCRQRCMAATLLVACWAFLDVVTILNNGFSVGAVVFSYIVWRACDLMKIECRMKC